ncbi:MAG: DUF58 domain-containing protein [Planctomycetota bacterium]
MALAPDAHQERSWLTRVLTTDFCPWANKFVYWLKEPIGWFTIAIAASVIVGIYANAVGWTIAGALSCIVVVGMIWPLIAVWASSCELHPEIDAVHEEMSCRMIFSVRNRIPIPLWGLAVEGYLDGPGDESLPVVALSHVPPICVADYAITVKPSMRGHYPIKTPKIACSFPFGIWTARRELRSVDPLTVWPRVYRITDVCPLTGTARTDIGDGQRGGRSGDFIGVRDFRRGDSLRHIHWAQSARTDSLIVTERGGPQSAEVDVYIDPTIGKRDTRQTLAVRMRVAASLLSHLHSSQVPAHVSIGGKVIRHGLGQMGRRQLLNALSDVPIDGADSVDPAPKNSDRIRIEIVGVDSDPTEIVVVKVTEANVFSRTGHSARRLAVRSEDSLEDRLVRFWQELGYAACAA